MIVFILTCDTPLKNQCQHLIVIHGCRIGGVSQQLPDTITTTEGDYTVVRFSA